MTRGENPRRINSRRLADLGPTNTGDLGVLESYLRFRAQRYPAERTALILMNHGSGLYVPPEMLSRSREKPEPGRLPPGQPRRRRRPLFHTTHEQLLVRVCSSVVAMPKTDYTRRRHSPFIEWLYLISQEGHAVVQRIVGVVESIQKTTLEHNAKRADKELEYGHKTLMVATVVQALILVLAIAGGVFLSCNGKLDGTTGVLIGTLVGFAFGRRTG